MLQCTSWVIVVLEVSSGVSLEAKRYIWNRMVKTTVPVDFALFALYSKIATFLSVWRRNSMTFVIWRRVKKSWDWNNYKLEETGLQLFFRSVRKPLSILQERKTTKVPYFSELPETACLLAHQQRANSRLEWSNIWLPYLFVPYHTITSYGGVTHNWPAHSLSFTSNQK